MEWESMACAWCLTYPTRRVFGVRYLLPALVDVPRADYDERVLPSIVNEVTKAVVAKYNASELLTKREV